ncbi:MAG: ribosomal subunit interface protein [Parcubacteria group bacterium RIFCSPLOWO2_01_FULL_40_65]|nr:MAG: ribosomal subunit interface protein [Parcubacteria group bacterium RIFCSPHIGHO2_01_FULL_40_30]OHB19333.1 MAG: ribosomal subunit interface protein [Parcubacteria group bacterium RIFCSPHIGHO2_02_FULL_40_12]OHB21220.1 MAG: ribosomal subunit interface protein [Parcubacteria group bacterium RIFCSPLOWO2_01_FULL_40_65]OHB22949.1 MAG: ribosomal subunit interface protein [Parcubacteria group bacterium RIFCSPLOWO2_02_FULL_40_12]OHB23846.1 MAG: ribosomal subunit interface protein [Parcubacteria gr
MKIKINSTNIKLDDALIIWIEKKIGGLEKFLKKIDPATVEARVEIGKPSKHHHKGLVWYAEVNLKLPGKLLRATNTNKDIRTAINQVKDELQKQIEKYLRK